MDALRHELDGLMGVVSAAALAGNGTQVPPSAGGDAVDGRAAGEDTNQQDETDEEEEEEEEDYAAAGARIFNLVHLLASHDPARLMGSGNETEYESQAVAIYTLQRNKTLDADSLLRVFQYGFGPACPYAAASDPRLLMLLEDIQMSG